MLAFAQVEETIRTNQTGTITTTNGTVRYHHPETAPPLPARLNQFLDLGDALHTLPLSRATVRFDDKSDLYLRDNTLLLIGPATVSSNVPVVTLKSGGLHASSRGGARSIPIVAGNARGKPSGTEFAVTLDSETSRAEFTMFDGEVMLSNDVDAKRVWSGWQGIATPGKPIVIRPIIEATNLVQWWIYYPGVLDADELGLNGSEQAALADSLNTYRNGDIQSALVNFPGYPTPPEPPSDAQRVYLAGLLLAVGAVDRTEALLAKSDSNSPPVRALRTMITAVQNNVAQASSPASSAGILARSSPFQTPPKQPKAVKKRAARMPPEPAGEDARATLTASELVALSYAHQATNNLKAALAAARAALSPSPLNGERGGGSSNGFAWARVAELEFSFGHTCAAHEAVERALQLSPRNAQAHA